MAATAVFPAMDQEVSGGYGQDDFFYGAPRRDAVAAQIRPFPNEDVLFWRKPEIDNSAVVRQEDPRLWDKCWKLFSVTSVAVLVVVGLLLPNAVGMINNFRLQQLREKNLTLREQQRKLELAESKLLNFERMEKLSVEMHLADPPPQNVHRLRGFDAGPAAARLDKNGSR